MLCTLNNLLVVFNKTWRKIADARILCIMAPQMGRSAVNSLVNLPIKYFIPNGGRKDHICKWLDQSILLKNCLPH
jgi:hypothetical protein